MIKPAIVLCDDLTGAMDTGVQLIKKGKVPFVAFDSSGLKRTPKDHEVILLDTESRNIDPNAAYQVVRRSIDYTAASGMELVYKKIDSTLRGNIGKELQAVMDSDCCDMVALVPALPQNGRVTREGFHYVHGKLLTESDLSRDPFAPVKSAFIPEIIAAQNDLNTGMIVLTEIREGIPCLVQRLNLLREKGCRIVILDAETENDLQMISEAIRQHRLNILPCGSAGLFAAMFSPGKTNKNHKTTVRRQDAVLTISGSPAKMSKLQIQKAEEQGLKVFRIGKENPENEADIVLKILSLLQEGIHVIIDSAGEGKEEISRQYGDNMSLLKKDSSRIQAILSHMVLEITDKVKIGGMIVFGGDTAVNLCRALGSTGIRITGEAEPFVPAGILEGGRVDGIPVVTKAGGFGSEEVIMNIINYLRRE